jgi:hypothetical protein
MGKTILSEQEYREICQIYEVPESIIQLDTRVSKKYNKNMLSDKLLEARIITKWRNPPPLTGIFAGYQAPPFIPPDWYDDPVPDWRQHLKTIRQERRAAERAAEAAPQPVAPQPE